MLRVAGVVVAGCLAGLALSAQQLPDATLRAGYLINFARFTEWPAGALSPTSAVAICVDDDAVFAPLRDAVDGKSIGERAITARRVSTSADAERCHIAYLRRVSGADAARLFPVFSRAHVLVVTDDAGLLKAGAIARFFIEDRRLRFAISLPHAERAGLQLSSRLLSLAVVIKTPEVGQ